MDSSANIDNIVCEQSACLRSSASLLESEMGTLLGGTSSKLGVELPRHTGDCIHSSGEDWNIPQVVRALHRSCIYHSRYIQPSVKNQRMSSGKRPSTTNILKKALLATPTTLSCKS